MNKTPIVFLPGTLCDERMWKFQQDLFPLSTVVDLRTQSTIGAMMDAVRKIEYPEFILVGFSLGGYVAQEFALAEPQRVKHLVLMGSSAHGYPENERAIVMKSRPLIEQGLFKGITDKRLREFLHPDSYANKELRDLIHSMAGPDASAVYLRQLDATMDRPDLSEKLSHLKCPLIAIVGREDNIVKFQDVLELETVVAGSKVVVLENCGHFVPLEKPAEVNAILDALV